MSKAIQITDAVYQDLVQGKELAVRVAEREGNSELRNALEAMGIGAFAGWLMYRTLDKLKDNEANHLR